MPQPTAEDRQTSALTKFVIFVVLVVAALIGAAVFLVSKASGAEDRETVATGYVSTSAAISVTPSSCALATISQSEVVTIDWDCVDHHARGGAKSGYLSSVAIVLQAIRDGSARAK